MYVWMYAEHHSFRLVNNDPGLCTHTYLLEAEAHEGRLQANNPRYITSGENKIISQVTAAKAPMPKFRRRVFVAGIHIAFGDANRAMYFMYLCTYKGDYICTFTHPLRNQSAVLSLRSLISQRLSFFASKRNRTRQRSATFQIRRPDAFTQSFILLPYFSTALLQ